MTPRIDSTAQAVIAAGNALAQATAREMELGLTAPRAGLFGSAA